MTYTPGYKYIPPLEYHFLTPFYDRLCSLVGFGEAMRREILSIAKFKPGDVILDVGCGTGVFFEVLKRQYPAQKIIGVDPDSQSLEIAKKRLAQHRNIELIQAFGEAIPLASGSVDVVFSTLALHHMPNEAKRKTIAEMHRVLKPEGTVVITDFGPSRSLLLYRLLLFWEESKYLLGNLKGLVRQYLADAGFRNIRVAHKRSLVLHFFKIVETVIAEK